MSDDKPSRIGWDDLDKWKFYINGPALFFVLRCLTHPANVIKTRLQVQTQRSLFKNIRDSCRQLVKREGFRAFYKGFPASCVGIIGGQVYVTTLEFSQERLPSSFGDRSRGFLSGALASLFSQLFYVPVDVVSERQMWHRGGLVQSKAFPSKCYSSNPSLPAYGRVFQAIRLSTAAAHPRDSARTPTMLQLTRQLGFSGLYRGYFVSLMTYMPYNGLWWMTYGMLTAKFNIQPSDILKQAAAGSVAGCVAATLTSPLDVVRTRIQVVGERSAIRTVRRLWAEEGVKFLSKGLLARNLALVPYGSLYIVFFETIKRWSTHNS